jgi:hypothetical protein
MDLLKSRPPALTFEATIVRPVGVVSHNSRHWFDLLTTGRLRRNMRKETGKVGTIQSQGFAIPHRNRNRNPNRRLLSECKGTGDWGLGTGDWGQGTGDWGLGRGL